MRPTRLWSLLLLPGALAAGHALQLQVGRLAGATPSADPGRGTAYWLCCLAGPLSVSVLARAVVAGLRAEVSPVRLRLLAPMQVLCFLGVELAEHAFARNWPGLSPGGLPLLFGLLAQFAVAWLLCAALFAITRVAGRRSTSRTRRAERAVRAPWLRRYVAPRPTVAMSSLSRRGPPAVAVI